mgnify:FL=1
MSVNKIILEAFWVGLLGLVIGSIVAFVIGAFFSVDQPTVCKNWNKNYMMELSLFLTGFIIHLFSEFTRINS